MSRYQARIKAQKQFAYYATKYIQDIHQAVLFVQNVLN